MYSFSLNFYSRKRANARIIKYEYVVTIFVQVNARVERYNTKIKLYPKLVVNTPCRIIITYDS